MTNLTQDHLDYHGDMQRYADAKAILFEQLIDRTRGVAVIFIDDEAGLAMRARARAAPRAPGRRARTEARARTSSSSAACWTRTARTSTFATPLGRIEIDTPLVGDYNLENLAIAVGMAIGARAAAPTRSRAARRTSPASRGGSSGSATIAACCASSTTRTRPTRWSAPSRRCGR